MEETESILVTELLLPTVHLALVGAPLAAGGAIALGAGVRGAGQALHGLGGGLVGALGAGHARVGGGVQVVAGLADGQGTVTGVHGASCRGGETLQKMSKYIVFI